MPLPTQPSSLSLSLSNEGPAERRRTQSYTRTHPPFPARRAPFPRAAPRPFPRIGGTLLVVRRSPRAPGATKDAFSRLGDDSPCKADASRRRPWRPRRSVSKTAQTPRRRLGDDLKTTVVSICAYEVVPAIFLDSEFLGSHGVGYSM